MTNYLTTNRNSNNPLSKGPLEIPDYLSGQNDTTEPEYFGSASNFSFVNQLNHFLQQLDGSDTNHEKGLERFGAKPMVLADSFRDSDFSLDSISNETMHELLVAFLETWTIPCPLFDAHQLFTLAFDTWKNPYSSANDQALLYLILSLGAATSYFDLDESSPNAFPVARGLFSLALNTVPRICSQVSFEAVRVVFFMSLCACSLGDTALSYLYTGIAVRILVAIGLHKNSTVKKMPHSFDSKHHRRVWVCVWQFEKYWSFCVGRPSGLSEYVATPEVKEEDFEYAGYGDSKLFRQTSEHMKLRVSFASSLSKVHAELYNTKNELLAILSKVERFSIEIDQAYFNCRDRQLFQANVDDSVEQLERSTVIEWFWIRIYYLYLKVIIFRPFLIFSAYLGNAAASVSDSIRNKIKSGSDTCVDVAIELSNFIIKLNGKVRMSQPIIFISTYLESASTVLLFYIVSNISEISDSLARNIWNVLHATRNFLNGSYGSYLDTTKILARDGLESLHNLLIKRKNDKNTTFLDKIMKPVVIGSPMAQINSIDLQDDAGLEAVWAQTLNWISYAPQT